MLYQVLLLFGVIILFLNIKNKIVNHKEKGKVLYHLKIDNRIMKGLSGVVIAMILLMAYSLYSMTTTGQEVKQDDLMQFSATLVLFIAVAINALSRTAISEGGILKNNNLIKWDSIKNVEWTGFNGKTCKVMIGFQSKNRDSIVKLTVKDDRVEKEKVASLIKQYRKKTKKRK